MSETRWYIFFFPLRVKILTIYKEYTFLCGKNHIVTKKKETNTALKTQP